MRYRAFARPPYGPQTQGKLERWHGWFKNIVKLNNYCFSCDLELAIASFVTYYSHHGYHESLNIMTPADVYFRRVQEVQSKRDLIKQKTLAQRRQGPLPVITQ